MIAPDPHQRRLCSINSVRNRLCWRPNLILAITSVIVSGLGCTFPGAAAGSRWHLSFEHPIKGKYEDFAVAGKGRAWAITVTGEVLRTDDAGRTWSVQARNLGLLRSLDFVDSQKGFAGTLEGVLYRTLDGGETWKDMTSELPRPTLGFCGITHVGERVHVVGRYYGEVADHYLSADGGKTWKVQDLRALAQGLVDVAFIDDRTGFIGGMAAGPVNNSPAIILETRDGGETWRPTFVDDGGRGFAWKIFPVTNRIIYVALQSQDGIYRVAKTTDAGETWRVLIVATGQDKGPAVQAVGFVDENHGFIGGFFEGLWETKDGGSTWAKAGLGTADHVVNRFEFIDKQLTTGTSQGIWVYKKN